MASEPQPPAVAVVGAGVLGLTCALRLAQQGAAVTLYEAAPDRPNASRIAAGMIAPAAECAIEPPLRDIAGALREARREWTALAAELGVRLAPTGTSHFGGEAALEARRALLARLGFKAEHRGPAPGAPAGHGELFTPGDALIATGEALQALRAGLVRAGGALRVGRVSAAGGRLAVDGEPLQADAVIVAAGAPGRGSDLAPELSALSPIKGQLLRWATGAGPDSGPDSGSPPEAPMLRTAGLYLATLASEVIAGATHEPGRDDLDPDPAELAGILAEALALRPWLAGRAPTIGVGVRADTPDGLPMAGPSARPGVFLATGARRNGWLFAPPVAGIVAAQVLGRPLGALAPLAERLHPGRFAPRDGS